METPEKKSSRKRTRGVALVAVAVFMVMFAALAVVAIDLGRLGHTATEAQNVADTAALAGALALADDRDAETDAYAMAAHTVFNGVHPDQDDLELEIGTWNPDTGFVAAAGDTATAVRATAATTVQNIVAGVFAADAAQSPVQRVALAGYTGKGSCDSDTEICFPIALGDCHFQEIEQCFADQSCLPELIVTDRNDDNAGWTGYFFGSNASDIRQLLPEVCGGTRTSGDVVVGDDIAITSGDINNVLRQIDDCLDGGTGPLAGLELTIPIVACQATGQLNQDMEVVGFATIVITGVNRTGNPQGVQIKTLLRADDGPGGGIAKTGTGSVKMLCDREAGQCG